MPLEEAVRQALTQVHGAFGLGVVCADEPDIIIGARRGSPLILGIGDDEYASSPRTPRPSSSARGG